MRARRLRSRTAPPAMCRIHRPQERRPRPRMAPPATPRGRIGVQARHLGPRPAPATMPRSRMALPEAGLLQSRE
eukprot:10438431-Alexandrium_andersonii.AAC.1